MKKHSVKVGDLVKTVKEYSSDTVYMGIVIMKEGLKTWVYWADDANVSWMPTTYLENIGESR